MYVLAELRYVLICHVKQKNKKSSLENALVEKRERSTKNKIYGLVEGLYLFSIEEDSDFGIDVARFLDQNPILIIYFANLWN